MRCKGKYFVGPDSTLGKQKSQDNICFTLQTLLFHVIINITIIMIRIIAVIIFAVVVVIISSYLIDNVIVRINVSQEITLFIVKTSSVLQAAKYLEKPDLEKHFKEPPLFTFQNF